MTRNRRNISLAVLSVALFAFAMRGKTEPGATPTAPNDPTATLPSVADASITGFDDPSYSWRPAAAARNQLVLFLPGTGGEPKEHFAFAEAAASLGYHVVSLMYPDSLAAQKKCTASDDPDCYLKFRLAIIRGGALSARRVITHNDSIEGRLIHLLSFLDKSQPDAGWGQYRDNNGLVAWSKLIVCGQSQGGGHAAIIAKYQEVARVICFGSPKDFSHHFNAPARGFNTESKTPLARYFAFNHMLDTKAGCDHAGQMQIFTQMGLTAFNSAEVDALQPPFNHAHLLFTNVETNAYHGSVINGRFPICRAVWKYVLTEPTGG